MSGTTRADIILMTTVECAKVIIMVASLTVIMGIVAIHHTIRTACSVQGIMTAVCLGDIIAMTIAPACITMI